MFITPTSFDLDPLNPGTARAIQNFGSWLDRRNETRTRSPGPRRPTPWFGPVSNEWIKQLLGPSAGLDSTESTPPAGSRRRSAPRPMPAGSDLMTADQAAAQLGISRRALYRRQQRGTLPCVKDGRRSLIPTTAIEAIVRGGLDTQSITDLQRGPRGKDPRVQGQNPCKDRFTIIQAKTGRWVGIFWVCEPGQSKPKRHRSRSPFLGKADTQRWAQDKFDNWDAQPPTPAPPTPTLAQACDRWFAAETADLSNKRRYLGWITKVWGPDTMIDALDHEQIVGLPARLMQPLGETATARSRQRRSKGNGRRRPKGEGLGNNTIRAIVRVANRVLEFAVELGWRTRAPTVAMPKLQIIEAEWLTIEELARLLAIPGVNRIVYLLGARAGLRRGEISELRWKHVDFENSRLRISASYRKVGNAWEVGPPKSGKARTVRFKTDLLDELRRLQLAELRRIESAGIDRDPMESLRDEFVVGQVGQRVTPPQLTTLVQRDAASIGLCRPGVGPHTLRHTFCSHLALQGATVQAIQKAAGHASMRTTERYMHHSPRQVEEVIDLLPALPTSATSVATVGQPEQDAPKRSHLRLV